MDNTGSQTWSVWPAGPVPANLLRWHLVFHRPVDAWALDSAVDLLDADGQPVPHAFVDWPGGLWDEAGKRLTLLMHPGRLKSGLLVRRNVGPALAAAQAMSLRLRPTLRGAVAEGEHRFMVLATETRAIDVETWRVDAPVAGGREPVRIGFGRVMDPFALPGCLSVVDANGHRVRGRLRVQEDGRSASFRPQLPWQAGFHAWWVHPEVEDLCGNRIGQPFEVHRTDSARKASAPQTPVALAFEIGEFAIQGASGPRSTPRALPTLA